MISVGALLCEELLRVGHSKGYAPQIAIYNSGSIEASISAGDVTVDDLLAVHPLGKGLNVSSCDREAWFVHAR